TNPSPSQKRCRVMEMALTPSRVYIPIAFVVILFVFVETCLVKDFLPLEIFRSALP
ncbi:hypothetical protein BGW80DRAFT_1407615, partial [Lactifluus volemus]